MSKCVYIYRERESLCYTAEINSVANPLHLNKINFKKLIYNIKSVIFNFINTIPSMNISKYDCPAHLLIDTGHSCTCYASFQGMGIRERTLLKWVVRGAVGTAPEAPQPLGLCLSRCLPPQPHPHPQPPGQGGLDSPGHRPQSRQPESLPARPGGSGPRTLSLPPALQSW